ncbi:MAG: PKD domain-containing protein, partial [Bacteroidales bacterium]|nr:PKD domain-containing protein [Bacteroidales bacterium]
MRQPPSGAKAVGLAYDHFYIPKGGKLYIYNEYRTQVLGAYDETTNPSGGLFSTELVQGSIVNIEYVAPKNLPVKPIKNEFKGNVEGDKISPANFTIKPENPRIDISELIYVYRNVPFLDRYDLTKTTGFGASGSCEVNVNCSEGASWQTEKRGVAEIWLKNGASWGWCTGGLVNTTNNSGIPYFLTADHCHGLPDAGEPYASAADMNQWQFYFNYESATCANPGTEPAYNTIIGCSLKACSPLNGGSDFCLVQLNTTPPQSYHPYYNGWDRTNTPASSGVGIHHPAGDIKKISTFTAAATSSTFNGGTGMVSATNAEWNVLYVATANGHGVVEGGSSGSPLFNQAKRVVGQLSGGNSACTNLSGSNLYGKFWYDWDQTPGGTTTQLKTWLDPVNSGSTTVNGYDPFNGYPDFYATPTTVYEGGSVNFTDITNGATSWSWQFEGGSPATSTVQNPTNIVYNQQGTYRVSLTTTTPLAGTQTIEKVGYITVLPGSPNVSIWCDDFSNTSNWSIINHSGAANQVWKITTAAPTGSYSATNPGKVNSTSGGNYALFDSDGLTTTNVEQWSSIQTTSGVNCSNYGQVILKFTEAYTKFYDSTLLYVSTDNFATSTRYVLHDGFANNQSVGN